MAIKKPADQKPAQAAFQSSSLASTFRTASDLLKEDTGHTENERRIHRWAELMIREKKLAPGWKEDRDAADTVRWISDRNAALPAMADKTKKKTKARAGEE